MSDPTEDHPTPTEVQTIPVTAVTKPPSPLLQELSAEDYAAIEAAMMEGDYSKLSVPRRLALSGRSARRRGSRCTRHPSSSPR